MRFATSSHSRGDIVRPKSGRNPLLFTIDYIVFPVRCKFGCRRQAGYIATLSDQRESAIMLRTYSIRLCDRKTYTLFALEYWPNDFSS